MHEQLLLTTFTEGVNQLNAALGKAAIRLVGIAPDKVSVQSFLVEGMHPFDTGMMLDAKGIAVRTGHHCTQPLMHRLGLEGTVRASFALYNTVEEVQILLAALRRLTRLNG